MKKFLTIAVFAMMLLMGGFMAAADCGATCPPEDIIIYYMDPVLGIPKFIKIKKGHFDDPDHYWTMEEWNHQTRPAPDPPEEPEKEKGKAKTL